MHKLARRILLVASLFVFVIVAPAIVLYAVGYRITSKKQAAVGVLLVDTVPEGARVTVNGKQYGTTPEAVSNLPTGTAVIDVVKEGYVPWHKRIDIEPTRAIEVRSIRLFAEAGNSKELQRDILQYSLAPNRSLIAVVASGNVLGIMSSSGEEVTDTLRLRLQPKSTLWSPDSSSILIQYTNGSYDLVTVSDNILSATPVPELTNTQVVFDPRLSGRLLVLDGDVLESYSVTTRTAQDIADDVSLFAVTSRQILTVENDSIVWRSLTGAMQQNREYEELSDIVQIKAAPGGTIAVQDSSGLIGVIEANGSFSKVAPQGSLIGFSPSGQLLLIQPTSSELAVFNVDDERTTYLPPMQLQTIIRLSRAIRNPQWFAGGTHVVYQADDELVISEVDTRDAPMQYVVDGTNLGNAFPEVGQDGQEMLYLKKQGAETSLYSKELLLAEDV